MGKIICRDHIKKFAKLWKIVPINLSMIRNLTFLEYQKQIYRKKFYKKIKTSQNLKIDIYL